MRARILTLLVGMSLAVAVLGAAPAAQADGTWNDLRTSAAVTDLPIATTVDLTGFSVSPDDPPTCTAEAPAANAWTKIVLTSDAVLSVRSSMFNWSWAPLVAIYPENGSTAAVCQAFMQPYPEVIALKAGTYDVLVGTFDMGQPGIEISVEVIPPPSNDDWSAATAVAVPETFSFDLRAATLQSDEPLPSCGEEPASRSQWYSFTAPAYGWVDITDMWTMSNAYALYTVSEATGKPVPTGECVRFSGTMRATPGEHYLLQVSGNAAITGSISLAESSDPTVQFSAGPWDPSIYDTMDLSVWSWAPAAECRMSFGDGSPDASTAECQMGTTFYHRYTQDGTYHATATVLATDGRVGTAERDIVVVTHDVAVTSLTAPKSAVAGKAKQISMNVATLTKYTETAVVALYAKNADGSWTNVGSTTVTLTPTKKSLSLTFTWVPASSDVGRGVVLKGVIDNPLDPGSMWGLRDGRPENNEVSSVPIKVSR